MGRSEQGGQSLRAGCTLGGIVGECVMLTLGLTTGGTVCCPILGFYIA